MTADQILSLLIKLNDTIDAQAQTIAALQARLDEKETTPCPAPTSSDI